MAAPWVFVTQGRTGTFWSWYDISYPDQPEMPSVGLEFPASALSGIDGIDPPYKVVGVVDDEDACMFMDDLLEIGERFGCRGTMLERIQRLVEKCADAVAT